MFAPFLIYFKTIKRQCFYVCLGCLNVWNMVQYSGTSFPQGGGAVAASDYVRDCKHFFLTYYETIKRLCFLNITLKSGLLFHLAPTEFMLERESESWSWGSCGAGWPSTSRVPWVSCRWALDLLSSFGRGLCCSSLVLWPSALLCRVGGLSW